MDLGRIKKYLLASLLINVLLLGSILGYGFGELWRDKKTRGERLPPNVESVLPKDKQKQIKQAMRQLRKSSRADFKALRKERRQLIKILTAPKFSAAAYQAQAEELHNTHGRLQAKKNQTIAKLASSLSQSEREALVPLLKKGPPGKRGRRPLPFGRPPPHHHPHPPPPHDDF